MYYRSHTREAGPTQSDRYTTPRHDTGREISVTARAPDPSSHASESVRCFFTKNIYETDPKLTTFVHAWHDYPTV